VALDPILKKNNGDISRIPPACREHKTSKIKVEPILNKSHTKKKTTEYLYRPMIIKDYSNNKQLHRLVEFNDAYAEYKTVGLKKNQTLLSSVPTRPTKIAFPISGKILTDFGTRWTGGLKLFGIRIRTKNRETVFTPLSGCVIYAGPFRSYKSVLILDVGSETQVIFIGIDRIDITTGQCVQLGSPIGEIGVSLTKSDLQLRRRAEITSKSIGKSGTSDYYYEDNTRGILYLELRENGMPVDPAPLLLLDN